MVIFFDLGGDIPVDAADVVDLAVENKMAMVPKTKISVSDRSCS